jgi:diguanylate cyclase (GGDEF)-like protein
MQQPLCHKYGFDDAGRAARLALLGLTEADHRLAHLLQDSVIAPNTTAIVERFYDFLLSHDDTKQYLGSPTMVARLRDTQSAYLLTLGIGFDEADYFEGRLRIGLAHARIGLPLGLYYSAYRRLQEILFDHLPPEHSEELIRFVIKVATLDMTLASETYHKANLETLQDNLENLRVERARLAWHVKHDELTHVASRHHAMAILERELKLLAGTGAQLCVLMADLDHFKRVNDTYGHIVGDRVLNEVASRMKACVRDPDVVGRYGGEEFIVVLPDTRLEVSLEIAERIRRRVEASPLHVGDNLIALTVSLGVAQAKPGETVEAIIGRADSALYQAKQSGRNCVVTYE